MKDFHELREKYGRSAASVGLGSKKAEAQDYEDALEVADGDDAKAAMDLENKQGYHQKDVLRIVKDNNPDIRKISKVGSSYKITYK
jgi:hypothetical protein